MNRNIDKANENIFGRLIEKVIGCNSDGKQRFIKSYSTDNTIIKKTKEYVKKTKISDKFIISRHIICAILEFDSTLYNSEKYFVISGIESDLKDNLQITEVDELGLMVVILSELPITLKYGCKSSEIENSILFKYKDDGDNYQGHLYGEIKDFFSPIKVFDISNSAFKIHQLAGIVLCSQDDDFLQPLCYETVEKFKDIFNSGNESIPYDNLVYGLHSISWKHKFIEIYRCIENLYPIFAIKQLYDDLNIDKSKTNITNFYQRINDELGWNRKERDSLEKIVATVNNDLIKNYFLKAKPPKYKETDIHNFLYDTRNSIVHFCVIETKVIVDIKELKEEHWNNIILGMLEIVSEIYKEYEKYIV